MSPKKADAKPTPPYLPYRTFTNFVDSLRAGLPSRIDRSVLGSLAGTAQTSLLGALRYLKLVTDQGVPTEALTNLVNSEGADHKNVLRNLLRASYPFLFEGDFQLHTTSAQHFNEQFGKSGTSGDTTRKAAAFFLAAAQDADIPLSRFIVPKRGPRPGAKRKTQKPKAAAGKKKTEEQPEQEQPPPRMSWARELLAKFPGFDPSWPDDVKSKWFDDFKQLMAMEQEA